MMISWVIAEVPVGYIHAEGERVIVMEVLEE